MDVSWCATRKAQHPTFPRLSFVFNPTSKPLLLLILVTTLFRTFQSRLPHRGGYCEPAHSPLLYFSRTEGRPAAMPATSVKNWLIQFSPVSDRGFSDLEKDIRTPLGRGIDEPEDHTPERKSISNARKGLKIIDARVISDAIIGLSDGLTVPFALTAGLSTLDDTKVVVFGGLAELIAGAISMGLGGYLGAKSEEDSYHATMKETCQQATTKPETTECTINDIFAPYDLPDHLVGELTKHLTQSSQLPSFLMNFHHQLPEPSGSRAITCALTIALGYFVGGFIPLIPYFFVGPNEAFYALRWSIMTMAIALFTFGYVKTCFVSGWRGSQNIRRGIVGGIQMVVVGGVAAGAAMGLVKVFQALAQ